MISKILSVFDTKQQQEKNYTPTKLVFVQLRNSVTLQNNLLELQYSF